MMLAIALFAAIQAAAPAPAPAAPNPDEQLRAQLKARGMSPAGINIVFDVQRRHVGQIRAIVQRGQAAETGMRAALAKRPIDVDGFAAGANARAEATAALSREGAAVSIEQMRAMSPADRLVLGQASPTSR